MTEFKLPTETVDLPSKGLLYPSDNPLSNGQIEMKYMTAKEEDILTNQSYIQNGTVIDKLLQSLIISKINYSDLLIGDKNSLLIASRILGYGKDYTFTHNGRQETIDLTTLKDKVLDESLYTKGVNEFSFDLPHTGYNITFKLLTHGDEIKIQNELKGLKKINRNSSPEATTRLKYMLLSIDGNEEKKDIRDFIDNYLLARDARALREHITQIQPDVDLTFFPDGGGEPTNMPIGLNFFWPDI
mgnify:CR=1 FL=1|tara:strand:- start:1916 stop:2644 length:729 start_codon:yes stop_codon:yes gene_type:complete